MIEMSPVVNSAHIQLFSRPYTTEVGKQALFDIPGDNAPDLDGYVSLFFRDTWSIINEDVTKAMLEFFSIGKLLKELYVTVLTLIPKVNCPNHVGDFRPIACCNTLYKCIINMLWDRIKHVLPDLIAENQGAFVHERFIVDNIMICQDLVKYSGRENMQSSCTIKLDMRKAYETIE